MTNCMKSKSKSISVLIPDGESSFLQIVVNCLSLVKNIKIFVISSNKSDFMKYSFFVEEYIFFTDSSDEEWLNRINHEVEKNNIDIIIPIFQNGFKRIIKHQKLLKNKDKLCVLPALSDFNTANDKGLLYYHMKASVVYTVKSAMSLTADAKSKVISTPSERPIQFACIARTWSGHSSSCSKSCKSSSA